MATIKIIQTDSELLLRYEPTFNFDAVCAKLSVKPDDSGKLIPCSPEELPEDIARLRPPLHTEASLTIKRVFTFLQKDLVVEECNAESLCFTLAQRDCSQRDYYRIPSRIFGSSQDVLIGSDFPLDWRMFCVGYERRTSVIKKMSDLLDMSEHEILLGGEDERAIPTETYGDLLRVFPTTTNLEHYGKALITSYIQDCFDLKRDYAEQYRKSCKRISTPRQFELGSPIINKDRLVLIHAAYDQLSDLLANSDTVPEEIWQQGILSILPILFPQYIAVIPKVRINDTITDKTREIDFLLVDASGSIDVLEIKRAFPKNHLIRKTSYRDNKIPARELSGGVMQIEKYLHLLLNWGKKGEIELTGRYASILPPNLAIKFINPRGLLLIGNCEFNEAEQRDFDLIRRQYAHVVDIITYSDLLQRLGRMLAAIEGKEAEQLSKEVNPDNSSSTI